MSNLQGPRAFTQSKLLSPEAEVAWKGKLRAPPTGGCKSCSPRMGRAYSNPSGSSGRRCPALFP